jgi:hypothetical protein
MRRSTCIFVAVGLVSCAQSLAQEDFNEPGANWNPTIYTDRWPRMGTFWRSPFAMAPCIPGNPLFPIAQGGDKEGAYSSPGPQQCEAYALVNTVPNHVVADSRTEGFVHLCPAPGSNARATVGYTARTLVSAGANPQPVASYMAVLSAPPGTNDVYLLLIRDLDGCLDTAPADGIIDAVDTLAVSAGPIGTTAFNYRLRFEVQGNMLTASAQRVTIVGGVLSLDPPVTLTAVDNAIGAGFNGVVASAANTNRVFWDDVTVTIPGVGPIGGGNNNCPCDWDADGAVTSADFFGFLTSVFQNDPAADLNGDEHIDSRDFFEFLECFFSRCE